MLDDKAGRRRGSKVETIVEMHSLRQVTHSVTTQANEAVSHLSGATKVIRTRDLFSLVILLRESYFYGHACFTRELKGVWVEPSSASFS